MNLPLEPDIPRLKEQLARFLRTDQFQLTLLRGGASARRYFLLTLFQPCYFPSREVVLMWVPLQESAVIHDFMHIGFYLKRRQIPTPQLYEIVLDRGWAFLEYVPWPTMTEYLKQHPGQLVQVLSHALRLVQQIQKNCSWEANNPAFLRHFDYQKFQFEFNFHVREQLLEGYFGYTLKGETERAFHNMAHFISERLHSTEPIFVHRDFQSSNLFWQPTGSARMKLIDFQDARSGTPWYDVVSLLWDSYLPIPSTVRQKLLRQHLQFLTHQLGWKQDEPWEETVDFLVIQRKLHDAGAFAYNHRRFGSGEFLPYIPPAINMAIEAMEKYPAFDAVRKLLMELINTKGNPAHA